ncbi:MAG: hypothetical protein NTU44_15465 [Bacteroidetes bacterium]|nr:hypothetical protein [Bacteroidota bacterium]
MDQSFETTNKPKSIRDLVKSSRFLKPELGIILGGTAGFLYYHFVGCSSGTCAITSNPFLSIIGGSFLGYFILNSPCSNNKC